MPEASDLNNWGNSSGDVVSEAILRQLLSDAQQAVTQELSRASLDHALAGLQFGYQLWQKTQQPVKDNQWIVKDDNNEYWGIIQERWVNWGESHPLASEALKARGEKVDNADFGKALLSLQFIDELCGRLQQDLLNQMSTSLLSDQVIHACMYGHINPVSNDKAVVKVESQLFGILGCGCDGEDTRREFLDDGRVICGRRCSR